MRRQTPVTTLLHRHLFPTPTASDPPSFNVYLQRHLIPEIRIETNHFYGELDVVGAEARYPGLNYTHAPHRMRLSQFPHHRRLFRAMDELELTDGEILDLVRWEGSLWARERYEREQKVKVTDTTGDEIGEWVDPRRIKVHVKTETTVVEERVVAPSPDDLAARDGPLPYHDNGASSAALAPPTLIPHMSRSSDDSEMPDILSVSHSESDPDATLVRVRYDSELYRQLLRLLPGQQVEMTPELEAYLKEQYDGNGWELIESFVRSLRENGAATTAAS